MGHDYKYKRKEKWCQNLRQTHPKGEEEICNTNLVMKLKIRRQGRRMEKGRHIGPQNGPCNATGPVKQGASVSLQLQMDREFGGK